jgi:hypothetical protein
MAHLGVSAWKRLKAIPRCGNHRGEVQASRGVGKPKGLLLLSRGMMMRLLGAHVKSSHASTKVHGRYCSAEARCALMPNRKLSLLLMLMLFLFRQPLKKEASTPSHLLVRVQPHDIITEMTLR